MHKTSWGRLDLQPEKQRRIRPVDQIRARLHGDQVSRRLRNGDVNQVAERALQPIRGDGGRRKRVTSRNQHFQIGVGLRRGHLDEFNAIRGLAGGVRQIRPGVNPIPPKVG